MKKFISNLEDKVSSVLNESLVTDAAELLGIEEQDAEERITGLSFANYIELGNAIDMEDAETVREILGSVAPLEEGLSDEDQRLLRYYSTKHPGPYDDELDIDTSGLEWDDEFGYNLETHPEYDKARLAYFRSRYAAPYADELDEATVDEEKLLDKPTPTLKDLAKKHDVSLADMGVQLAKGIKAEKEHTSDMLVAKEIALDHLNELPDYYDRLEKMEETGSGGGTGAGAVGGGGDGGASAGVTAANGYGGIGTWDGKKQKKQKGNIKGTGKGVYEGDDESWQDELRNKLDNMEKPDYSWAKKELYHVTRTEHVPGIQKNGLRPMGAPSNWVQQGNMERYGMGEIYVFTNKEDAKKWAARMDWEFNQTIGSGNISIVTLNRPVDHEFEKDEADPMSQAGAKGDWLKTYEPIEPEYITGAQVFKSMNEAEECDDLKLLDKPTLSVREIADKHDVPVAEIASQLAMGIKVELEHSNDRKIAKEIALDHLMELPDYYSKLDKMENESIAEADNPYASAPSQGSSVDALAQQTKTAQPAKQAGDEEENNLQQRKDVDDLMVGDDIEVIDIDGDPTPVTVKTPRGPGDTVVVQTDKGEEHIVKKQAVSGTPTIQEMYEAALNSSGFSKGDRVFYQPTSGQAMGDRGKGYGTVVDTTTNEYGEENVIVEWDNEEYAAMGRLIHPAHLIKADDNEDEGFWNDMEADNPFECLGESEDEYCETCKGWDEDDQLVCPDCFGKNSAPGHLAYESALTDRVHEAYNANKTEHSGAKKGKGGYYGRKKDAKHDSNKKRRSNDKKALDEVAPPGMEDWIKKRKPEFKKQYGDDWEEVLYATAWKRHNNESIEEASSERGDYKVFYNNDKYAPDFVSYYEPSHYRADSKEEAMKKAAASVEEHEREYVWPVKATLVKKYYAIGGPDNDEEVLVDDFNPATHVNVEHRDPEGRFIIVHAPPAGYWAVGKGEYKHDVDATGFDNFDDALEHAELCLASLDEAADLNKLRRLAGLKETASGGATGAGAIASAPTAQGDMVKRPSIYDKPTPKKRKKAKESNDGSIGRAKK